MKKLFGRISPEKRAAFLSGLMMLPAPVALAQGTNLGEEVITSTHTALIEILDNIVSLLQVMMGIAAIVILVIVVIQIFKGEREAASKLAWWIFGLTIGFLLLTVVSGLIETA